MTKAEIVAKVAEEIKFSKAAAGRALAVITDAITQTIRQVARRPLSVLEHSLLLRGRPEREGTRRPAKRSKLLQRRFPNSLQVQH